MSGIVSSRLGYYTSGASVGLLFGMALEKSKVFHPELIQGQMAMTNFTMVKVFLTATGVGVLSVALLDYLGLAKRDSKANSLGLGLMGGYGGNVVGGTILGIGMTLAGACPGTVMVQLSSGVPSAVYTMAGCALASLSFGYIHKAISRWIKEFLKTKPAPTLDKMVHKPLWAISLSASVLFLSIVGILEYIFPWQKDIVLAVANYTPSSSPFSFSAKAWHPVVAGALIGLLQVPSYLTAGAPLGASSSYMTFASHVSGLIDPKQAEHAPYLNAFKNPSSFHQLGIMTGVLLGSYFSRQASHALATPVTQSTPLTAFIGGLCLIIGARVAGGCTSGHGISGIARLSFSSLITSAFMFVGGIASQMLFDAMV